MMKKIFNLDNGDTLKVIESDWFGSFQYFLNNEEFRRIKGKKRAYLIKDKYTGQIEHLNQYGNVFSGYFISFRKETYNIVKPCPWYVYVLGLLPFITALIFGNVDIAGFKFLGGIIGGLIGGAFSGLSIVFGAYAKKTYTRLIYQFIAIALTFLICWLIGTLI